jgi:predicted ATPase/DNA-binding XRE family transcriptional regulator
VTQDGPGSFGGLLQRLRAAAGLSQEELAERAGLSQRGISDLERGRRHSPHPATMRRLAEALGLAETDRVALLGAARAPGIRVLAGEVRVEGGARHNLPLQVTSFVGRVQETADLRGELARTRLLTLAGPGGVGKTRLALHLAEQELGTYRDGIWLVELAPVQEAALVAQLVANVFNIREKPQEALMTTLTRRLQALEVLLILDNCEHVLGACVDLVNRLLRACSHIVVLTTSREVLGLAGETVWRVPALRVPDLDAATPPKRLTESEAAALFVERARAVQPGFVVTPLNATALLEVCRRLEGIPLAIELAASRLSVLSLQQIAERLATHLRFLSSKDPTVESRQQTLEKTIHWSYDLLTPAERHLFDRMSVFTGGWSIEAMQAVAGRDTVDRDDLLDVLERLVDKSLVLVDNLPERPPRYRLLEPLRQYGQDRLREHGEAHATQECHAAFFLGLFEQEWERFVKRGSAGAWLSPDLDNLRTAMRWLIEEHDVDRAQRLAVASWPAWSPLGYTVEGRRWLEEALALDPAGPHDGSSTGPRNVSCGPPAHDSLSAKEQHRLLVQARVLWSISHLAVHHGDLVAAEEAGNRSLELYRRLGDAVEIAVPLNFLGRAALLRGNFAEARHLLEQALAARRQSGMSGSALSEIFDVGPLCCLAQVAGEHGNAAEARERADEALKIAMATGHPTLVGGPSAVLGKLHYQQGRPDVARSVLHEGLARLRQITQRHHDMIPILLDLGRLAGEQGDDESARAFLAEGVMLADQLSRWHVAHGLEAIAELAAEEGLPDSALQLAGAAAALRDALGTQLWPTERMRLDAALVRARERVSPATALAAWTRGSTTTTDQAIALALDLLQHWPTAA